jgi:opacity protein-like surface antigen
MKKFVYTILLLLGVTILYTPKVYANKIKYFIGAEFGVLEPESGLFWKDLVNNNGYFNGSIVAGFRRGCIGIDYFYQLTSKKKQNESTSEYFSSSKAKFSAAGFDVNGYYQLDNNGLEIFGGLGIVDYEIEVNYKFDGGGNKTTEKFRDYRTVPRLILGVQQNVNHNVKISTTFRHAFVNLRDLASRKVIESIDEINVGLKYIF